MRINRRYAIIAIIICVIGALILAFGQRVGLIELARGSISGFVFALATVLFRMEYDVEEREREKKKRRRRNLSTSPPVSP